MRILVVEDDEFIAQALLTILTSQNYAVEVAANGQIGWELIQTFDYDLVLLDVVLPQLDGISLCRQMRSHGLKMPILLLTGQDSSHQKAVGLDAGADDYVVKPFDQEELVARVRALLRRGGAIAQPILRWGQLSLDPSSCDVAHGTTPLLLTPKEYALLELFLRNPRRVFSCGMILEHLWSYGETPGEEAVRTHIKGLRQKLKAVGLPGDVIETVYGIGYRLKPREEAAAPPPLPPLSAPEPLPPAPEPLPPASSTQKQLLASVSWIWHRFQDRVLEQVAVLEQAAIAAQQSQLDDALRDEARQQAHSLAGSLGTFGVPQGSQVARHIEHLLQQDVSLSAAEVRQLQAWVTTLGQEIAAAHQQPPPDPTGSSLGNAPPAPPLLLVVPDRLALPLRLEAERCHLRSRSAVSLPDARTLLAEAAPEVVVFAPEVSPSLEESALFLAELSQQVPPISVILLTDHHQTLLEQARLGGILLQTATPSAQVLDVVQQSLQQSNRARAKVMIVDDDPQVLALVRSLLEPWGLKITTLNHPQAFWSVLEAASPDLLILDIEMPQMNGIELCQVVRNDARWASLPILFLTAHTDSDTVIQVFSAGADDFVSKPIIGPELITRILNRLERIRFLRNFTDLDPLTQLASRQKSTQDLTRLLHLAQRQAQPLCLAIANVQQFKRVNDRYGHATGDEVLYQIGQLLRRSLRADDIVSRWGGAEFVIGLYGMTRIESAQRCQRLLQQLRQQTFPVVDPVPPSPELATVVDPLVTWALPSIQRTAAISGVSTVLPMLPCPLPNSRGRRWSGSLCPPVVLMCRCDARRLCGCPVLMLPSCV